jgi:predicted methyltransferase
MTELKKFAENLKAVFKKVPSANLAKRPYENTYSAMVSVEKETSIKIDNDKLKVSLKKYSFTEPNKQPIYFYRVVAQFDQNIYYNSFYKLVFDDLSKACKFYSNMYDFIQEAGS